MGRPCLGPASIPNSPNLFSFRLRPSDEKLSTLTAKQKASNKKLNRVANRQTVIRLGFQILEKRQLQAVTTTYGLDFQQNLDLTTATSQAAATSVSFTFIGSAAFTDEGQIRVFQQGAATIVQFNVAGSNGAEMEIVLRNFTAATLDINDFIIGSPIPPMMLWNPGETGSDLELGLSIDASNNLLSVVELADGLQNHAGSLFVVSTDSQFVENQSARGESVANLDLGVLDAVFADLTLKACAGFS